MDSVCLPFLNSKNLIKQDLDNLKILDVLFGIEMFEIESFEILDYVRMNESTTGTIPCS